MALIALESRDLVRDAALAWITFFAAARSSDLTNTRNSVAHFSASLAAIDSRSLRKSERSDDLVARLRARRTTLCRRRFLVLAILGMDCRCSWSVVSGQSLVVRSQPASRQYLRHLSTANQPLFMSTQ